MRHVRKKIERIPPWGFLLTAALIAALTGIVTTSTSGFAETNSDYTAAPPYTSRLVTPNVLIILDNSNSMDEDLHGSAVGSDAANSRSEIARQAVRSLIQTNSDRMRIGLMAYQQTNVQRYELHDAFYYCSFDPNTYDPAGTPTPKDPAGNTLRFPNPVDAGNYIYFDQALPMYSSGSLNNAFCYCRDFTEDGDSLNDNYWCYQSKQGVTDPPSGITLRATLEAGYGYSDYWFGTIFIPTDEDIAAGFTEFGEQLSWVHVGPTWFSNASPGAGYLHVSVEDSTAGHLTALEQKLATANFSTNTADHPNNDLDTSLRNAGLTPLAGTLESARFYFEGNLPNTHGGPQATPIQNWCQKNFVVLVTDGLPSVDKIGTPGAADALLAGVESEVELLRSTAVSGFTDPFDIQTFVLGFALPPELGSQLDAIAVAGGTDVEGHAYLATNADELAQTLASILLEIFKRASSGTAASVVSNSRAGAGGLYQSIFYPYYNDSDCSAIEAHEVNWVGQAHGLFVDNHGNMREDTNQNRQLDLAADKFIAFDPVDGQTVYKYVDSNGDGQLGDSEESTPSETGKLKDIKFVWSSTGWLNEVADATLQRTYDAADQKRYIFTFVDADGDMVVDSNEKEVSGEPLGFTTANVDLIKPYLHLFPPFTAPPGGFDEVVEAEKQINYIRGADQTGMRSRQIDYDCDDTLETWRLGDVVHSTPTSVGAPAEDYDLIYKDTTYQNFYIKYKNRRNVIYAGANDGMLHAFNAGFYDRGYQRFDLQSLAGSETTYPLGAEMWAYVPHNLLPHLYWLTTSEYAHVYYVDLKPKVFDAKIFTADSTHPNGWGTVLVAGMRFGGGKIRTDKNHDGTYDAGTDEEMMSAYIILDITDPESPPQVLAEVTFAGLGYSTSYPTAIVMDPNDTSASGNKWYLVLGSGPIGTNGADTTALTEGSSNQQAKIYIIDLVKLAQNQLLKDDSGAALPGAGAFQTLPDSNSFVSDLISVDLDLDYKTDALYFGTISGSDPNWGGELKRIVIGDDFDFNNWDGDSTLIDVNQPIAGAPTLARDRGGHTWIYFGTGRFLNREDALNTQQQSFYAIKESWDDADNDGLVGPGEDLTWDDWDPGNPLSLLDVTNATVYEDGNTVTGVTGATNFDALEALVDTRDGWKLDFSTTGERNLGQAALLGDILTFTTYIPNNDPCEYEGSSKLYSLYYRTGTAFTKPVIGYGDGSVDEDGDTKDEIAREISLGKGLTITPNIHTGREEGSKAFIQVSTGAIQVLEQTNPGVTKSGKTSWLEDEG